MKRLLFLCLLLLPNHAAAEPLPSYKPTHDGYTPPHILAVVQMHNGGTRCSGTVISRGETHALILSARHCVQGNIGNSCQWINCDGSEFSAELIAVDEQGGSDLCLFRAASRDVLARSWVPLEMPEFVIRYEAAGYTGGGGLKWKKVAPYQYAGIRSRYRFDVSEGAFAGGDSGGAVFADGALISVISASEPRFFNGVERKYNEHIYGVTQPAIRQFLTTAVGTPEASQLAGCGRWGCRPRNRINLGQPQQDIPQFSPEPNIEIKPNPDTLPGEGEIPGNLLDQISRELHTIKKDHDQFRHSMKDRLSNLEKSAGKALGHVAGDVASQVTGKVIDEAVAKAAEPVRAGFGTLLLLAVLIGAGIYFWRR